MAIRERLIYAIDVVTDGANKGLAGFRKSVSDADGATGKFKAGASSAFSTVKANAGAMAIGAGASIVAFGIKASQEFTKLALDAEKFALATGGSTEEMSRWMEVAGDLGISTEQVQGGFVKLEKAIGAGSPAVEELGLSMQTAADGSADVTGTMLSAIRALDGVKDPATKAKLAADLFGRGFADMAELVTGDADEITRALGRVSDAKIIDADEVAKAKKNREVLDGLKDSVEDLTLAFGENFLPVIAGAAEGLMALNEAAEAVHLDDVIGALDDFDELGRDIGEGIRGWFDEGSKAANKTIDDFEGSNDAARDFDRTLLSGLNTFKAVRDKVIELGESEHTANLIALEWAESQDEAAVATASLADGTVDLTDKTNNLMSAIGAADAVTEAKALTDKEAADAADRHREAIDGVKAAMDRQTESALGLVGSDIAVRDAQRESAAAQEEFNEKVEEGFDSQSAYQAALDETTTTNLNTAQTLADLKARQMEANGETVTATTKQQLLRDELSNLAAVMEGPMRDAILGLIADLDAIPNEVNVNVNTNFNTRGDNTAARFGARASGGRVQSNEGVTLVGESGPELVSLPAGSMVHTAAETMGMQAAGGTAGSVGAPVGGNQYTINLYGGNATPEAVVNAIKQFERRNGAGWRS